MWVGYLFTDIEGSTERWERFPDRMLAAVGRHDSLLDTVIESHGGVIQNRAGDGVFALFANGAALRCAIDLQRRLQDGDWGDIDGLWIRIGVHASPARRRGVTEGQADFTDQIAVNRASRIMACGWGGQTVVSSDAVSAFGLPDGSQLDDLGMYQLRGIDEPLRLYGLTHPDLKRTEFPPLHSLSAHSQSIPAQLGPLFGRDKDLKAVHTLLGNRRAVTIVGPGGNGKTRLAAEVAKKASATRPVYFVQLAGFTGADELVSQIASTLRFPFHGSAPRESQLIGYLREKAALLVLDNVDAAHASSALLDRIIADCPRLTILATSRGALGVTDETIYPLHGLKIPGPADDDMPRTAAFQCFVHEAKSVSASFKIDRHGFETLREICDLLSGSPLALRLAAHWSRLLSLDDVLARLRTGLGFLDTTECVTGREGALRSVFEGSWTLLTPDQKAALARLSVLVGDFDVHAAQAIASIDAAALAALEARGLVSQSGRRRFQMHAIIREYAREKLAETPEHCAATRDRHAEYYLGMVCSAVARSAPADQGRALDHLQAHIGNVRAGWVHTLTTGSRDRILSVIEPLFYFLAMRSLFHEASQFFNVQTDDHLVGLYGRSLLSNCLLHQGDFDKADVLAREVLASEPSHPLIKAHALQALGGLDHVRARFDRARNMYQEALAVRSSANDLMGSVYSIVSLASLYASRGELVQAREQVKEAFRLSRRVGNTSLTMSVAMFAGDIAMREQRLQDARAHYAESLRLEEAVHNPQYRTGALLRLGVADAKLGDGSSAAVRFREALELAADIGDRRLKASALLELGAILRGQGDVQSSLRHLVDAVNMARTVGSDPLMLRGLLEIGQVEIQRGNVEGASRISALLAVADMGILKPEYEVFAAGLGPDAFPQVQVADWRLAVDEILEDAEIGAWNL